MCEHVRGWHQATPFEARLLGAWYKQARPRRSEVVYNSLYIAPVFETLTAVVVNNRFYLPSSGGLPVTRTCTLKTVGYSAEYYRAFIPRGREVNTRAAEVPADYETKSRKVTLSTAAGHTSVAARRVLCSPSCALFHQSPASALASPASSRAKLGRSSRQLQRRAQWCPGASGAATARIRRAA